MNIFIDSSKKLSRYSKIQFLGEGQFANVYLAKDCENNNKYVAIKKVNNFTFLLFLNTQ